MKKLSLVSILCILSQVINAEELMTVVCSPIEGGTFSNSGYEYFIAIPNVGYTFDKWVVEEKNTIKYTSTNDSLRVSGYVAALMYREYYDVGPYTFTAYFTKASQCTITTTAQNGTVTGGGVYEYNATATLTATPNEHYQFVRWSDGNTDNPRTVTVTNDSTFTAEFAANTYTLPVTGTALVLTTSGRDSCDYVQLWAGGPKWATFNVGATIINYDQLTEGSDATSYYSYSDQAPYYNTANVGGLYAWNNPNLNGRRTTWTDTISTGIRDVATTLWGTNWKTPTKEQLDTLQSSTYGKTTWTWCDGSTTQYVAGCTIKGYKVSGVGIYAQYSIFLPAAGYFNYGRGAVENASDLGGYWSSTEYGNNNACNLSFRSDNCGMYNGYRKHGRLVRAVLADSSLTYTISTSATNGSITGAGAYAYGTQVTLTATPNEHYQFVRWLDGNTDNPRMVMVTKDTTFTAIFAIEQFTILATSEHGSVIGTGIYESGATATITATSNDCYTFQKWSDGNTDNPRSVVVTQDSTFTAIFEKTCSQELVKCTVVNESPYGTVKMTGAVAKDSTISLEAVAPECSKFVKWSDNDTSNPRELTVTKDSTLTAIFEQIEFNVSVDTKDAKKGKVVME